MKLSRSVLSLAVATALGAGTAHAADLKIAIATAVTGPVAQYGDMQLAGARKAIEDINAKGGVNGMKLVGVEYDDGCEPKQSPTVANKVINDKIHFVIGHLCSGAFKPAAKIYDENDVLMITPASTADEMTAQGYKALFRTIGKDSQQGPAAGDYIAGKLKPKALAIIHDKQTYGQGVAEQVRKTVEAKGIKPVMFEGINKGDTDFSALITKLKQAGVDAVYYGGYHPELIVLLKQAKEQGLAAKWMGPEGVAVSDVKGEPAEGLLVTLPPDFSTDPANAKLVEEFKAKKQDPSGPFVLTSYAAVQVVADAVGATKSTDPLKVADYIHKNKFKTAIGEIGFTDTGDLASARFDIFEWHKDATKTLAK